jgi:hypothetical protein
VIKSDFRNDMMEGRQKYEQSLTKAEFEKYFNMAFKVSDTYITVE